VTVPHNNRLQRTALRAAAEPQRSTGRQQIEGFENPNSGEGLV
jgi:hypothetical protein